MVAKVDTFPQKWETVVELDRSLPADLENYYLIDVTRLPPAASHGKRPGHGAVPRPPTCAGRRTYPAPSPSRSPGVGYLLVSMNMCRMMFSASTWVIDDRESY